MTKIKKSVIVTGDRNWHDRDAIGRQMGACLPGTLFIHGNAMGADNCCDEEASAMGYPRIRVPYFSHLGRAGGVVRNEYMLQILLGLQALGADIEVMAFHDNITESKGTKDMVKRAKKAGMKVRLFKHGKKTT
jgi:hypothetical protein